MTDPVPFVDALRAELVAAAAREVAARRRRSRRPRVLAAGAAALGAAAAAIALLVPSAHTANADVVVRERRGLVIVTLEDVEHRPERIEAAVRAAGLDVSVRAVPVGPSNVGRFVGQESAGALPPELRPLDAEGGSFRGFVLPAGWPGSLRLLVGSPARGDERYAMFSNAFAPGEPLACEPLVGRTVADAVPHLLARDLRMRFDAIDGVQITHLAPSDVIEDRWAGWLVLGADGTGRRSVVVRIGPPAAPAPPPTAAPECRS